MVIFHWNKELESGIALIDQQHKQLVETVNSYLIRQKCVKGSQGTIDFLGFLQQYTLSHFPAEESYQVKTKYPAYRSHQAKHNELKTKLKFFSVWLRDSQHSAEEVARFREFIVSWIEQHILVDDLDFIRYYRSYKSQTETMTSDISEPPYI